MRSGRHRGRNKRGRQPMQAICSKGQQWLTTNQQIRALIERWATAVHAGDLDAVLADHADDIVMFDVPPPHDGVRGIDAYRDLAALLRVAGAAARRSRSHRSTSPPATTSRSPTPCCAADTATSSPPTRTSDCG